MAPLCSATEGLEVLLPVGFDFDFIFDFSPFRGLVSINGADGTFVVDMACAEFILETGAIVDIKDAFCGALKTAGDGTGAVTEFDGADTGASAFDESNGPLCGATNLPGKAVVFTVVAVFATLFDGEL